MFAPEGTRLLVIAAAVGTALAIVGLLTGGWGWALVALGALAFGATLWAYRDPLRSPPAGADLLLLAPADGQVVEVADEHEPLYLDGPSQRVSIALSPLDVRVGRVPATGTVEVEREVPADGAEPSGEVVTGLRHPCGVRILVRRLPGGGDRPAGRVGRRASAGERHGLVGLGSRVDVAVPPSVELDVMVGQRMVAGETVIGRLPAASAGGDGAATQARPRLVEVA